MVELKNQTRTLYKVYNHSNEMKLEPVRIKVPENDKLPFKLSDKYDVYIQSHAINRMPERLYRLDQANSSNDSFKSFSENKITWFDNQLLIEFKTNYIRTGYLYATLHKNFVIVRSFLFLTYKNTPECKQLHSHTGLQKNDWMDMRIFIFFILLRIEIKNKQKN